MADKSDPNVIKSIHDKTVEQMVSLGVYKPEFEGLIGIYSQLVEQYDILTDRFERGKYKIQTKSAQGGMKKAPIVATLESLRKDIATYSDRLCLNPKAFKVVSSNISTETTSKLDRAMEALLKDDS